MILRSKANQIATSPKATMTSTNKRNGAEENSQRFRNRLSQLSTRNFERDFDLTSSDEEFPPLTFARKSSPVRMATPTPSRTSPVLGFTPPTPKELQEFTKQVNSMSEADFLVTTPESSVHFWSHYSTKRIGNLLQVRRTLDIMDNIPKVFICKTICIKNQQNKTEQIGKSIIKFPAKDLAEFTNNALIPLQLRSSKATPEELFGIDPIHNYTLPEFWEQPCVVTSPNGCIMIRPFYYHNQSRLTFRIWQKLAPMMVSNFQDQQVEWAGPQMSLSQSAFLGLIKLFLEEIGEMARSEKNNGQRILSRTFTI